MQLNEILEEHSVKVIIKKTNISEENIEALLAGDFDTLKKVKTLGFISIIEREYKVDLSALREQALSHYTQYNDAEKSIVIGSPIVEERKGKSKLFLFFILVLFGYASWYFFTQFDKNQLSELLPFTEEKRSQIIMPKEANNNADLSIENVIAPVENTMTEEKSEPETQKSEPETQKSTETNTTEEKTSSLVNLKESISIVPSDRLWFGIIDMQTKQRDHFSISEKFELDVKEKSWLLATSSAPFSLLNKEETKEFNDAQEHYFMIDKSGIKQLKKTEYVAQGGWYQW